MKKKNIASSLWVVLLVSLAAIFARQEPLSQIFGSSKKPKRELAEQSEASIPQSRLEVSLPQSETSDRLIELPAPLKGMPEQIIKHEGYTLSFNKDHCNPNWVAWELTAQETEGTLSRYKTFLPDPLLPEELQVTSDEYRDSGYDRGHMCPAADMKWSKEAMKACFYMSNMCPQVPQLNSGGWQKLEAACRRWAVQEGRVYIICGPVYNNQRKRKTIGKKFEITIPTGFFKCVLSLNPGREKAIGFYYANKDHKQSIGQTVRSVDEIEELTGMNFFVFLEDKLEKRLEASCSLKEWQ